MREVFKKRTQRRPSRLGKSLLRLTEAFLSLNVHEKDRIHIQFYFRKKKNQKQYQSYMRHLSSVKHKTETFKRKGKENRLLASKWGKRTRAGVEVKQASCWAGGLHLL